MPTNFITLKSGINNIIPFVVSKYYLKDINNSNIF